MYILLKEAYRMFVPVVDMNNVPLMSTTPSRGRRWIKSGKVMPFLKCGVFCVRLNVEPSGWAV
ncbi:RRXRR domain-containing protein [Candidatus Methylacidiphilum infernorum]|uniref:RRXRR domain-containing protein n=1 Tax=Candidatus Methylacidiphilum infernorum TaxID=511746 RepID=UPI0036F3E912